jgi:hypothetical protein
MKKTLLCFLVLLGIVMIEGCGSQMQMQTGDKMNPSMTPAMKNAKLHGHAKSAQ